MPASEFSCCGGKSCCENSADELDRRDFIKTAAAGFSVAGLLEAQTAAAAAIDLDTWNASLLERGQTRVYRGAELKHIAMPLGGIGAGQVYLRGDGTLNPWQNFNNFNSNAMAPDSFFAIRAKPVDGSPVARLLQLQPRGDAPAVQSIEFSGEYPFAWIRYADDALPVQVQLEAFSPFIPLNSKDSGLPAIIFRFRIRNNSAGAVDATVLGAVPNLIGWDGYARPEEGPRHSEFGGNTNALEQRAGATILTCASVTG